MRIHRVRTIIALCCLSLIVAAFLTPYVLQAEESGMSIGAQASDEAIRDSMKSSGANAGVGASPGNIIPSNQSPSYVFDTTLIAPVPGSDAVLRQNDLSGYINALFKYGISLAALIALAQLIFGAVQYTTSAGAPSLQEDAKSRMRGAIIGLILLILSISIITTVSGGNSFGLSNPGVLASTQYKTELDQRIAQLKADIAGYQKQLPALQQSIATDANFITQVTDEYKIKLDENSQTYNFRKEALDGNKKILAQDQAKLERTDLSPAERADIEQRVQEGLAAIEAIQNDINETQLQTLRIIGERNKKTAEISLRLSETKRIYESIQNNLPRMENELKFLEASKQQ